MKGYWVDWGKDRGYTCSACQSGCLLNLESDWCPSEYCPHCGAFMVGIRDKYGGEISRVQL